MSRSTALLTGFCLGVVALLIAAAVAYQGASSRPRATSSHASETPAWIQDLREEARRRERRAKEEARRIADRNARRVNAEPREHPEPLPATSPADDAAILELWPGNVTTPELARACLRAGADVNAAPNGFTALHAAAMRGDGDVAAVLIKHGAHLTPLDSYGRTPTDLARVNGHVRFADTLDELAASQRAAFEEWERAVERQAEWATKVTPDALYAIDLTRDDFGDEWPLTVDAATLAIWDAPPGKRPLTLNARGQPYALNDEALSLYERFGAKPIEGIRAEGKSLEPLRDFGRQLYENHGR